jgi:hypothetical protein
LSPRANKIGVTKVTPMDSADAGLQNLYVLRLPALGTLFHVELDRLAFLKAAEPGRVDRRVMNENVLTVLAADESETLGVVEPLYCSLFHFSMLFSVLNSAVK